jgi:ribosomal protein L11 methyltransferase
VAAAVLGAGRVEAVDIDPDAVGVAMANAERNGVADRVAASAAAVATLDRTFDLVVANLTAATLAGLAADLVAAVAPGGWLLMSGMLAGQWTHVAGRFAALAVVDLPELDGWTGAVLRAGAPAHRRADRAGRGGRRRGA